MRTLREININSTEEEIYKFCEDVPMMGLSSEMREMYLHYATSLLSLKQQQKLLNDQSVFNEKLLKQNRNLTIATWGAVFIALASIFWNYWTFHQNLIIEGKLDRPYLNIDASKMQMQLRFQESNHNTASTATEAGNPVPFNDSFSFTITNVGKLPARYRVDLSSFKSRIVGAEKPLFPSNNDGVIFPNDKIELIYDIRGIYNPMDMESMKEVLDDWNKPSQIKIFYGYPDDTQLNFETLIDQEATERNCDIKPTPGAQCFPADWIVRFIN